MIEFKEATRYNLWRMNALIVDDSKLLERNGLCDDNYYWQMGNSSLSREVKNLR